MAANDTLKIAVQIVEDDKKNVESLVKKVQLMLDKDFKLKVSDDGALKHLEEILSVLKQIQQEMGNLSGHLGKDTWGKLSQNTQDAVVSINKLSAELERLDTKFAKTFGKAMGTAWAKEMKKGEQGAKDAGDAAKKAAHDENELSTAIVKTSSSVAQCTTMLNRMVESSREAGSATHGIVENMRSMDVAGKRLAQIDSILAQISKRTIASQALGFDIGHLERMADMLRKTRAEFLQVFMGRGYAEIPGLGMMDANSLATNRLYDTQTTAIQKEMKAVDELAESMRRLQDIQRTLRDKANGGNISAEMRTRLLSASEEITATMQKMAGPRVETSAEVNTALKEQIRGYEQLSKEASRASDEETKGNERVRKSLNDLLTLINDLNNRMKSMKMVGVDSSKIQSLQQTINTIQAAYDRLSGMGGTSGGRFIKTAEYDTNYELYRRAVSDANQAIREQTKENRDNDKAKREAAKSTEKLSEEEKKLANAMKQTSQQGFLQTNVLNDLKSMAAQYLSIWGAKSFVENMAQITGELELQQKSLEVIIGSASYASQLFGEIRDLSQQSPYTFQDLLKSTRQLAAFGIETKDLYGTMKSLSDIGAGLSVDVQRLILAYGHTKSYGYLSGIQNRQFETAGIDLVGALADRYNKLADAEERAGRAAEHVTRKDVFKMISKKEVGFEDVNAVIMGLDAPGGRFYNMQERQFETLGGKLRNLRNNYNIMMAEMGKANHGMLMGGVNMLNELTEHWDKYARIITAILVPITAFRLATMALNTSIGLQTNAMSKNVMAMVRSEKAMVAMNAAAVKRGFFSPLAAIGMGWSSQGNFTPDRTSAKSFAKTLQKGLDNGSLSKTNLMYMGLSGDLPERYRRIALALAGVRGEQVKTMASANGLSRAWMKAKISAAAFGASLKGFVAATVANPMTWIMAAIAGVTYLIERVRSLNSAVSDAREKYGQQANQDVKNIDEIMRRYDNFYTTENTAPVKVNNSQQAVRRIINVDEAKLEGQNVKDILDELKKDLQAHAPLYDADVFDIEGIETEAGRVQKVLDKLESHRFAKQVYSMIPDQIASANRESGGWFNDTFAENAKDYQDAMRAFMRTISKIRETEYNSIIPEQKKQIEKYIGELGITRDEAIRRFMLEGNHLTGIDKNGNRVFYVGADSQVRNVKSAWKKVIKDSTKMVEEYSAIFKNYFQNDPAAAEDFLLTSMRDLLNDNKVADPEVQKNITDYISTQISGALKEMDVSDDFKKAMEDMVLMAKVKAEYQKIMEGSNLNWASTRTDVDTTSMNAWSDAFKHMIESANTPETKEAYRKLAEEHMKEYADGANQFWRKWHPNEDWKNKMLYATDSQGNQTTSEFSRYYQKEVNEATDYFGFWFDTMKNVYDKQTKDIKNMFVPLKQKWNIEIDPSITFQTKDLEKLKQLRDKVAEKIAASPTSPETKEQLKPILDELNKQVTLEEMMKEFGIDFESDKNKRGGGRGTYKDREYELWEQRVKIIQEARREYDYWEKAVGKESAQDKVKKQFDELISKSEDLKKALKPGDLDNLEKYRDVLIDVQNEARQRYEKNLRVPEKKRNDLQKLQLANDQKILRDIAKTMNDIDKMDFEKATEKFVSGMSLALDDLSRRWEIFNSIREKVGNDNVSARIAGLTHLDAGAAFASDAMRAEIDKFMKENAAAVEPIDFSKILGLDEDSLTKTVQQMFRVYTDSLYDVIASDEASNDEKEAAKKKLVDYEQRIKAVINALKEWQKAEKEIQKNAQEAYADVLGKAMDYASRIVRINANLKDQIDLLQKANNITPQQRNAAINRLQANAAWEREQVSGQFGRFFNSTFSESRNTMLDYANKLKGVLNNQFKTGAISAQKYADELNKIDEKMKEFDGDKMVNYFSNGLEKILQRRYEKGVEERDNGLEMQENGRNLFLQSNDLYKQSESIKFTDPKQSAELANQAQTLFSEGSVMSVMGSEMAAMGEGMMAGAQGGMQALAIVDQIVHGINDMVQSLKELKDDIYETLDSFGVDLNTDAAINASAFFDGFAEASEGATKAWESLKSGNVVGVAQGVVQSFTGWIKAFNAAHDKRREVRIQKINDQLTEISNTLDLIRSMREKELGYSTGYSIRSMASMYRQQEQAQRAQIYALLRGGNYMTGRVAGKYSAASAAMADYYERAAGAGETTYAMEYNKLLEQRRKKMEQYNLEADKKKVDRNKLEQYKKDIAELDTQVQEFASTLLNDLWGIDFKGWASQISDALMTAFENGTSAASAFHDTMEDIMADVVKRMMNLAIIEPFIKQLQNKIIGYTDQNGNYHAGIINTQNPEEFLNHPEEYVGKMLDEIAKFSKDVQDYIGPAAMQFLTGSEDILNQNGFSVRNRKSGKGSSSNSISQSITEETAGYLTGLLSAMHQDGSVRRLQLQTIVAEQMPNVIEQMTVSGSHIAGIDENTRAIMNMMNEGSGRMYAKIDNISTRLDRFASGLDKITAR